jgi:hypothetical protein
LKLSGEENYNFEQRSTNMKKLDILKDLYEGRISEDEAYDIQDQVGEDFEAGKIEGKIIDGEITLDLGAYLGLTRMEWAAILHNASYNTVAKWRYEGWPTKCAECGKKIIPEKFGWKAKDGKEGKGILIHIPCLKPYRPGKDEIH